MSESEDDDIFMALTENTWIHKAAPSIEVKSEEHGARSQYILKGLSSSEPNSTDLFEGASFTKAKILILT